MKILGIDPAFSVTGYGLIEVRQNKITVIEAGVITTNARQPYLYRLNKIYDNINKVIDEFGPGVMVLEKLYAHHRHPTTAYFLGQVKGIAALAAARKELALFEYAATRIKKAITGSGSASKFQVQRMIVESLKIGKLPKYTDVTDALALAVGHSYISRVRL